MNEDHHVVWADRVGLNKSWARGIEEMRGTYGSPEFSNKVWGLHTVLINIRNGPQLRKTVDDFLKKKYDSIEKQLEPFINTYAYRNERDILEAEMLPELANFMIQLLEDNGFGFYESSVEEDEMS